MRTTLINYLVRIFYRRVVVLLQTIKIDNGYRNEADSEYSQPRGTWCLVRVIIYNKYKYSISLVDRLTAIKINCLTDDAVYLIEKSVFEYPV